MADKFIPTFTVQSDDLAVTDDEGVEHHPHAGEWVKFRRDMPWRLVRLSPDMPDAEYTQTVIDVLVRQIRDWSWTGEDGQPLPRPEDGRPFVECLWDLANYERVWLRDHCWQAVLPNA